MSANVIIHDDYYIGKIVHKNYLKAAALYALVIISVSMPLHGAEDDENNNGGFKQTVGKFIGAASALALKAVSSGASLTSMKATAAAAAKFCGGAAATPYVVPAVVVGGLGYGGYHLYRSYNPTPEQKARIAESLEREAEAQLGIEKKHEEQNLIQDREAFRTCLKANREAPRQSGVPTACMSQAASFAMRSGEAEVERIIAAFNKYEKCHNNS
jgi:hypothetical protein